MELFLVYRSILINDANIAVNTGMFPYPIQQQDLPEGFNAVAMHAVNDLNTFMVGIDVNHITQEMLLNAGPMIFSPEFQSMRISRIIDIITEVCTRIEESQRHFNDDDHTANDTSVNLAYKSGYETLKSVNAGQPTYTMEHIYQELGRLCEDYIAWTIELNELQRVNTPCSSEEKPPNPKIRELSEKIGFCRDFIDNKEKLVRLLKRVEQINVYFTPCAAHEINILLEVWRRIYHPENRTRRIKLTAALFDSILEELEDNTRTNDSVPANQRGLVCDNGRIGAYLSPLEGLDSRRTINLQTVPLIRMNILQNRLPSLLREHEGNKERVLELIREEFGSKLSAKNIEEVIEEARIRMEYV